MNPVSDVNWRNAPMSPEREIFREYATGKIQPETYFNTQAILCAEGSYKFQPQKYPTCSQAILDYCELRTKQRNDASYSDHMSKLLGEWVRRTKFAYDENTKDLDVFKWAMNRIFKINGHPGLEKLNASIMRFVNNENEFDPEPWKKCIEVLKIDGEYRVRRDSGKLRTG